MNTLNSGSFWLVSFSPSLLFSLKETRLSPGSIFECWASLGNHGYIPVSNPCSFFRCSCQMQASIYSWMSQSHAFSFTRIRFTELFPFPVPRTDYWQFFSKKGYQACIHFLYLFLSFNKQLFQPLHFTFSCTLVAFIKGIFFDVRVKIIVLPLANYKSHRLSFLFHALPRIIVNAMNSAWHPVDLHFVLLLML